MIPVCEPYLDDKELKYVLDAVKSGWISSIGKYIDIFENEYSRYCGTKYGVATSNGTTALHLALTTLGIEKGDEVLIPDLTFIASANAVKYCNAQPVFVDVHPEYWGIDPEKIEEKITIKTKAIMPVHLYGHPCDMDAIRDIANDRDLYIIEDAAEAHGAEYKGKKVGGFGDISCFSFYGNKIITTGEGGICLTNNDGFNEKARMLRDHAMSKEKRYWHDYIGYNYRMTNLQAAIGVAQMEKIDKIIKIKRNNAEIYSKGLKSLSDEGIIELHPEMKWARCVFWLYCILVNDKARKSRDQIMNELKLKNIDSRPFFYPINFLPPYYSRELFVNSEKTSKKGINLPSAATINSKDILKVIDAINELLP